DDDGNALRGCGADLERIARIDAADLHPAVREARVEVVCDVDNPLLGPRGASRVYGPQKGASPDDVERLEAGMANLADRIEADLGVDVRTLPGAGAAGGLGAGLHAFLGGALRRGVDVVLDLVHLDDALEGADLVLTAEGALDNQTAYGKAPAGVARRAQDRGVPCLAIAGAVGEALDELHAAGIAAAWSLCPRPAPLETAMAEAAPWLRRATEQVVRAFRAGRDAS
ncbi:MAG: glycerate kinase, partial [Planctomycetota bacterium]